MAEDILHVALTPHKPGLDDADMELILFQEQQKRFWTKIRHFEV